jgi:hypothetical protein
MKRNPQYLKAPLRQWGSRSLTLIGLTVLAVQPASAVKWVGPGTPTDFNSSANWANGTVPGSGDQALFQNNANATLSSDITVGYLTASFTWDPGRVGTVTIDAGANTLTLDRPSSVNADASATGGGTLNLKGNIALATSNPSLIAGATSRIVFDSATLSSSGAGFVPFVGGGTVELSNSSTASSVSRLIVNNGTSLEVSGTSTINGNLEVKNGSSLVVGGTSSLTVTGDILASSGTPDSKWVIDLAGTSPSTSLISATDINITDVALDLSNVPIYTAPDVPYVLATYSGTLTGNEFASVAGLGHHQIVYNFGPNANQIAIIPELSHATPLLSGLLPLLMVRVRRRRGSCPVAK